MKGKIDQQLNIEENFFPNKTIKKAKENYIPDKEYIVTAKWKLKGNGVLALLERIKSADYKFVEENEGRYIP